MLSVETVQKIRRLRREGNSYRRIRELARVALQTAFTVCNGEAAVERRASSVDSAALERHGPRRCPCCGFLFISRECMTPDCVQRRREKA